MCSPDSGMAQESHASPTQLLTRDAGIEQELTHHVKQQYQTLKEEVNAMERLRSVQALEFQEKLHEQRKMLTEMRDLLMVLIREGKRKDPDVDDNDILDSEVTTLEKSVMC